MLYVVSNVRKKARSCDNGSKHQISPTTPGKGLVPESQARPRVQDRNQVNKIKFPDSLILCLSHLRLVG